MSKPRKKAYLGIDPGLQGGFAFLEPNGILTGWVMPENLDQVWEIMFCICRICERNNYELSIALEKVHAMPKQGVTSMFTFGFGYGAVCMAVVVTQSDHWSDIIGKVDRPTPQEWQSFLGITKRSKETEMRNVKRGKNKGKIKSFDKESQTDHKKKLYSFVQKLLPTARICLALADAALLAYYAKRLQEPYEPQKEAKPKAHKIGRSLLTNR